ncbi:MAG: serine/threonine protein kinase [Lachnospiraceae bacterium]|nr:serine/threonine protein kinase [Lachnospiraceae bacterium]
MLEIGSVVDGKYKILNQIGRGGMSIVYLAINEKANKLWAIKEMRRDGARDYEAVKQGLIAETDLLKKLRHESLPSIVDVIEEEDTFLVVMDYIEGKPLSTILAESGAQPQEEAVEWAKQLCDVLGYLHSRNPPIIYRDMKPSNVMLRPDGRVILIDFGAAREYNGCRAEDTQCLGTRGYAAPEQYGGRGETTVRTDIYGLGATLYHLVTGQNPGEPPYEMVPIRSINPTLSSGLEEALRKCTRSDPDERYQSCAELRFALDHYRELDVGYRKAQNRKWFAFLACAILTVVCFFGAAGFRFARLYTSRNSYEEYVAAAEASDDRTEQVAGYEKAIRLNPSRSEAYVGLLAVYLEDGRFSGEEETEFRTVLGTADGERKSNEACLRQNKAGYAEVAWEAALAYYFYYENRESKNTARKWCGVVAAVTNPSVFEENGEARIYRCQCLYRICDYYSRIGVRSASGDTSVSYADYWADLMSLTEGNLVAMDVEKTACIMYNEVAVQLIGHSREFLSAGVSREEITAKLDDMEMRLDTDFTSTDAADQADAEAVRIRLKQARAVLATMSDASGET